MNMVINNYRGKAQYRYTLLAFASHGNPKGENIYPSAARVADIVGVSRRQIGKNVSALIKEGVLNIVGNASGGDPNKGVIYRINLEKISNPSITGGQNTAPNNDSTLEPQFYGNESTLEPQFHGNDKPTLELCDTTLELCDTYPRTTVLPNNKNNKNNTYVAKPKTTPKKQTNKATRIDPDLELSNDWKTWAEKERPELDAQKVFNGFKNYWLSVSGAKGLKNSWIATWKYWVTNQEVKPYNKAYEDPTNDYRYYVQPEVYDKEDPFED
jgi:hypothetical protein